MDPTPPLKKEKGRTGRQASEPTPGHPGSGHFLSRTRNLAAALWVPGRNDSGSGPLPAGSERKEPGRRGPEQAQRPVSESQPPVPPSNPARDPGRRLLQCCAGPRLPVRAGPSQRVTRCLGGLGRGGTGEGASPARVQNEGPANGSLCGPGPGDVLAKGVVDLPRGR